NSLGGKETEYTAYNFTGQPTRLRHVHTAQGKAARTEVRTYSYDHAGRLLTVKHKLDALGEVTLVNNVYDDLGRLQSKSLHGSAVNKQTYTYNIRGWLTGVSGSKFTQNLYYNTGNGVVKYNGSISSMTWKAGNESTVRGYKFTYDGLDRLLNAIYGETAGISTNANRFSENVTNYDKNGNIKGLQRYGQTGASAYGLIDNLTFTLNGNRLNRVDDAVTASTYGGGFEFKDGVKQANEYAYDANGNLTKDLNKGITGISYNCLNLPNAVTFSDGSTITYTYGADGTKLRTVHKIGSATTTTDYCGNVIYENGVQKLLLTEEGYVTLSDSKYHYYLKDHQGNNRVVINQSGTVEETNHYYPFGGVFASAGSIQPYKYNGKEFDNKKGLNWYDYGARHYDAALGRFTTNDRFAEKYYSMSPYQYGANNPVNNIDVNGDTIVVNPNPNGLIDNVRMFFGFDTKYQKDVKADLQQLKKDDKEIGEMIIELEKSKNVHSITRTKRGKSNSSGFDREKAKKDIPQGSIINYDLDVKTDINGNHRTPRIGLSHELQHSSDVDKGIMSYENIGNGIPMREIRAINTENKIRKRTGDAKRTEYRGRKIPQKLLE
ncbi:RHS repeat-associated core domain-containing protein, partial [Bacteroides sp.]